MIIFLRFYDSIKTKSTRISRHSVPPLGSIGVCSVWSIRETGINKQIELNCATLENARCTCVISTDFKYSITNERLVEVRNDGVSG